MSRDRLIALGGGIVCAVLYLSVISGSPGALTFAYLSQLPLYMVGLSLGLTPALIASGIAIVAVVAATPLAALALFLAFNAVPAIMIVRQALVSRATPAGAPEWYPAGLMLSWLTAYGLVLLIGAALWLEATPVGFEGSARGFLTDYFARATSGEHQRALGTTLQIFGSFFPAAVLNSWLMMVMINATIAQGVLSHMGHALRPSPRFSEIWLPSWPAIALAVAALAALTPGWLGYVGQNALLVMAMPFLLVGLAVVHVASRRWPSSRIVILIIFYLLLFMLGWPALIVAALGFADQWLSLRQRLGAPGVRKEEE